MKAVCASVCTWGFDELCTDDCGLFVEGPGMARPLLARRLASVFLTLITMMIGIVTGIWNVAPSGGWTTRIARATTTTIAVTTTRDELDGDTSSFASLIANSGGEGISLREALTAANAEPLGPLLHIHFAIPESDAGYDASTKVWRIRPDYAALPTLTRGGIVIDGATQPGATLVPYPVIVLDGTDVYTGASGLNGLTIASAGNIIRGLALVLFWDVGIVIEGATAHDNIIAGCFISVLPEGIDLDGLPSYYGIDIRNGAHENLIGGSANVDRNIISGNDYAGIRIDGSTTMSNTVAGNWIGVDVSGTRARPNVYYGVIVSGAARGNIIGEPGNGNVISGNDFGIMIWGAHENRIVGNVIGLAPDQSKPIGNREGGVFLVDGASNNIVGGVGAERNIISGNGYGIFIGQYYEATPPVAHLNRVLGNYIGVDASGIRPRGNTREGIELDEYVESTRIGGDNASTGNVIAYNGGNGMTIAGSGNHIAYNLIGVGADRTTPLGNQRHGAWIRGHNNIVGPSNIFATNQLSGLLIDGDNTFVLENTIDHNARSGLCVKGDRSTIISNTVRFNQAIAAPWDGFAAQRDDCALVGGIVLTETSQTLIRGNTISDNAAPGVTISGGARNKVSMNSITANVDNGILLLNGANEGIDPPTIQAVDQTEVRGIACPGCRVEIFADAEQQGREFLGAVDASNVGTFSLTIRGSALASLHITATSTDANNNTSAFAAGVSVPLPPVIYTIRLPLIIQ